MAALKLDPILHNIISVWEKWYSVPTHLYLVDLWQWSTTQHYIDFWLAVRANLSAVAGVNEVWPEGVWHHELYYALMKPDLTHWGLYQMAAIFQGTFSIGSFLMKMYEFRSKFHWTNDG